MKAWNISVTLPDHEPEASLNVDFFLFWFCGSTESSRNCWTLPPAEDTWGLFLLVLVVFQSFTSRECLIAADKLHAERFPPATTCFSTFFFLSYNFCVCVFLHKCFLYAAVSVCVCARACVETVHVTKTHSIRKLCDIGVGGQGAV